MDMNRLGLGLGLLVAGLIFASGCGQGQARSGAHALGADSKLKAIRIARAYVREQHPGVDLGPRPPTASFFRESAPDGKPLWVVCFTVSQTPHRATQPEPTSRTLGVWVRTDGSADDGETMM